MATMQLETMNHHIRTWIDKDVEEEQSLQERLSRARETLAKLQIRHGPIEDLLEIKSSMQEEVIKIKNHLEGLFLARASYPHRL